MFIQSPTRISVWADLLVHIKEACFLLQRALPAADEPDATPALRESANGKRKPSAQGNPTEPSNSPFKQSA